MIKNLNKILVEWAYRTHDGKPNPKSMTHQIILSDILREYGWPLDARIEMVNNLMEQTEDDDNKIIKWKDEKGEDREATLKTVKGYQYDDDYEKSKYKQLGVQAAGLKGRDVKDKDVKVDKPGDITKDPDGFKRNLGGDAEAEKERKRLEKEKQKAAEKERKAKEKLKKDIIERKPIVKDKVVNNIDDISQTTPANKVKIKNILDKALNSKKLTSSESKFLSKWVRVVEPVEGESPEYKIYIARFEDDFRRSTGTGKKAEKVEMGSSKSAAAIHKELQKMGVITERVSTFGGKKSAPSQIYAEGGRAKIIKEPKPTLGVEKNKAVVEAEKIVMAARGNKNIKKGSEEYKKLQQAKSLLKSWARSTDSVTIGTFKIEKQDLNRFEKGSDEYKKAAQNNREMADLAEKIALGDMDFIDMDEGLYPDSPQNRERVIQSSLTNMLAHFDMLGSKPIADGIPAADLPENTVRVLNKLRAIAAANPNGGTAGFETSKQWYDAFEETMSEFANDDKLKEGWANFAEVFTAIRAMHDNGKGTENGKCVLLPESSTLETVDVIQLSRSTAKSKFVTLDGLSVKKGKGGASALTAKITKAVMTGDDDGIKKKTILEMSKSHTEIYEAGVNHKDYRKKQKDSAIASGVPSDWVEQVEAQAISTDPKSKVNVALNTIMKRIN